MKTPYSCRHILRNQRGMILPLVLVFLVLGLLLLAPALGHGYTTLVSATVVESKAEQIHAADSGVEEGLYWLIHGKAQGSAYELAPGATLWHDGPWVRSEPYTLNNNSVSVTVTRVVGPDEYLYTVTSIATGADGGSSTVVAQVYAVPFNEYDFYEGNLEIDHDLVGNIFVDGNLSLETGNTTVTGDVVTTGTLSLTQGAEILGDVYSVGDVSLGQSALIQCTVFCTEGDLTMEQQSDLEPPINVEAELHFLNRDGSVLTLANQADINGDIYSWGNLTINMNNPTNVITGNILVDGDLTIDMSDVNAKGTINGNLYATGLITIKMGSKHSDINGTAHFNPGNYVEIGDSQAGWPDQYVCGVDGPCDNWPTPQHTCPGPSQPEILSWQVT